MAAKDINLTNWRSHPQNQWSFINIDKILPTATIDASSTPSTLPSSPISCSDFQLQWKDGKILSLAVYIRTSSTDSLIILQHGKILYENYFNNNTPSSKHILMSMSKSITSLLVGILQGQGKLAVSDLITAHIPELSNHEVWKEKTIQQCLDMRTNFKFNDNSPEYREAMAWNPPTSKQTLKSFLTTFQPDSTFEEEKFEYCSINTDLLGWVLENASGSTLASLLQKYLWEPLGCESPALVTLDRPEGLARAAGGICATLRDTARIAQMLLKNGKNDKGEVVVPEEYIRDILTNGDVEAFNRGSWAKGGMRGGLAYRNCFLVNKEEERMVGLGIFGQMMVVDKKNGIVMVRFGSQAEAIDFEQVALSSAAFREVQRVLKARV